MKMILNNNYIYFKIENLNFDLITSTHGVGQVEFVTLVTWTYLSAPIDF